MTSIKEILRKLDNGILPEELDFTERERPEIDWGMVKYNTFYKDPDYYINRFPNPNGFRNLPAYKEIINSFIENVKSPLEEMNERQKKSCDIVEITNALDELPKTINQQ